MLMNLGRLDSSGESSSTRKVVFPDKLTFMLASKEEGGGQRSIPPTSYVRLFHMKVFCATFLHCHFRLVLFCA